MDKSILFSSLTQKYKKVKEFTESILEVAPSVSKMILAFEQRTEVLKELEGVDIPLCSKAEEKLFRTELTELRNTILEIATLDVLVTEKMKDIHSEIGNDLQLMTQRKKANHSYSFHQ